MRKLIGLLSLLFFIGLQVSYAQTRTISGIVTGFRCPAFPL